MSKIRYLLVFLLVLIITIFTRWLLTSVEEPGEPGTQKARHDPDYFISNFDTTIYDQQGKANYRLVAQHMEHFPDDDTMEINKLRLEYTDPSNQQWIASSDRGTAYKDIEVLHMMDNVKVVRGSSDPADIMTLYAKELKIDLIKRIAITESEVKIVGKNSTIDATGMLIEIDAGKMTFNARTRAEYAPN